MVRLTAILLFRGKPKGGNKEPSAWTTADTVTRDISMKILMFSSTISHFICNPARVHYQIQLSENARCGPFRSVRVCSDANATAGVVLGLDGISKHPNTVIT